MVFDEATLGKVSDSHVSHLDRFHFFKNTKRTPKNILNFFITTSHYSNPNSKPVGLLEVLWNKRTD